MTSTDPAPPGPAVGRRIEELFDVNYGLPREVEQAIAR